MQVIDGGRPGESDRICAGETDIGAGPFFRREAFECEALIAH